MMRKPLASMAIAAALLGGAPAFPQPRDDNFALGRAQFAYDDTGSGAVLCAWSIYLETQAATAACGLPRTPTDDAIDKAVLDIDDFIMANSSLHPTRSALEKFKRGTSEAFIHQLHGRDFENYCRGRDLATFRSGSPVSMASSVRALLAKPREPVMNPCL
jgi:hypothetical protein